MKTPKSTKLSLLFFGVLNLVMFYNPVTGFSALISLIVSAMCFITLAVAITIE